MLKKHPEDILEEIAFMSKKDMLHFILKIKLIKVIVYVNKINVI